MQSSITFDVFTHLQLNNLTSVLAMSLKWIFLICAVRDKFSLNHSVNVLFSNHCSHDKVTLICREKNNNNATVRI